MQALHVGNGVVQQAGLLTTTHMLAIQAELEQNHAGFLKLPGITLKNRHGAVVYTPPQDPAQVVALMSDLRRFINETTRSMPTR